MVSLDHNRRAGLSPGKEKKGSHNFDGSSGSLVVAVDVVDALDVVVVATKDSF